MPKVTTVRKSVTGTINFLDNIIHGVADKESLIGVGMAIKRSLNKNVLVQDLDKVYEINDSTEMRTLISTRGTPKLGSYSPNYKAFKRRKGLPPHVLTGTMRDNIMIEQKMDRVLFYIPSGALNQRHIASTTRMKYSTKSKKWNYFNFGPIHERKKSILKATVVFGWEDIMSKIRTAYSRVARRS